MKNKIIKIVILFWGIIVVICAIYALLLNNSKKKTNLTKVENETHWIKGNGVRLRAEPSVSAKILDTMQGGNGVIMLESIEPEIVIGNQKGRWAKVQVLTGKSKEKIGFIFDAFLINVTEAETLFAKAKKLEALELGSAIQIYESILRDFPSSGRNADDYESNGRLKLQMEILKCWNSKTHSGFLSKELLFEGIKQLTLENDLQGLKNIAHCEFLLWNTPCAGGPYPRPTNEEEIKQYLDWVVGYDWKTLKDNCIEGNHKTKKFCFYLDEYKSKFYWSGGCYNDPTFLHNQN